LDCHSVEIQDKSGWQSDTFKRFTGVFLRYIQAGNESQSKKNSGNFQRRFELLNTSNIFKNICYV